MVLFIVKSKKDQWYIFISGNDEQITTSRPPRPPSVPGNGSEKYGCHMVSQGERLVKRHGSHVYLYRLPLDCRGQRVWGRPGKGDLILDMESKW